MKKPTHYLNYNVNYEMSAWKSDKHKQCIYAHTKHHDDYPRSPSSFLQSVCYQVNSEADCVTGSTRRTLALRNVSSAKNTVFLCCCLGGWLCDCPTKPCRKQGLFEP